MKILHKFTTYPSQSKIPPIKIWGNVWNIEEKDCIFAINNGKHVRIVCCRATVNVVALVMTKSGTGTDERAVN